MFTSTSDRLSTVFKSANEVAFDDSDKFVLFADCHRGDNSWADDFAHNQTIFFRALQQYYNQGFTYIEIGDGDELWENKRFEDIRKAHSHVFWLMGKFHRDKRLHLIWGNHNRQWKNKSWVKKNLHWYQDERKGCRVPLFKGIQVHEGLVLRHSETNNRIFLVHGHQGQLFNDWLSWIPRCMVRRWWARLQRTMGWKDPTSPAKNFGTRQRIEKQISAWAKRNRQMVIAGHTHRSVFPSVKEPPYFNVGSCVHPRCVTAIEIENGEMSLVKWWVTTDHQGVLTVKREVLPGGGPEKLASFFGALDCA